MINEENKSIYEQLTKPFEYSEINWRITNAFNVDKQNKTAKAIVVPYLQKEAIQDRLDNVFGFDGWSNDYRKWGADAQLCGISFKVGNEIITKFDGAGNSSIEELKIKGGLTDSFKRAAKMIGIGRYLAKFNTIFLDVELKGAKDTPTIKTIDLSTTLKSKYNQEIKRIFNISPDSGKDVTPREDPNTFNENNGDNSQLMISQKSLNFILLLLNQKRVNIQNVLERYSVDSINELTEEEAKKTISILSKQKTTA